MPSGLEDMTCPYCGHRGLQIVSFPVGLHCPSCDKKVELDDLSKNILQVNYRPDYQNPFGRESNLIQPFGQQMEISDDERKSFYFKSLLISFVVYAILFACLSFFFPLKNIPWGLMIYIFIASRIADIVSTLFALALGATETNPMSDPHNIGGLISLQTIQVFMVVGLSFLLGLINPWLKIGLLFVFSLMGFQAFLANVGQALSGPASGLSEASGRFYTAQVISIILVVVAVIVLVCIFI